MKRIRHRIPAATLSLVIAATAVGIGGNATADSPWANAAIGWGYNRQGQLGNEKTGIEYQPVSVHGNSPRFVDAATSGGWSMGLAADGTVWTWGSGAPGDADERYPTLVPGLQSVTKIAAASEAAFAVRSDGTVWGWGSRLLLGMADGPEQETPVQIPGVSGVMDISASPWHVLAQHVDRTVTHWGINRNAQAGNGEYDGSEIWHPPAKVPGLIGATVISAGVFHNLVVKTDGTVWAWGTSSWGGNAVTDVPTLLRPTRVPGLSDIASVSAGHKHSLALGKDGKVWSWGENPFGQLGSGTMSPRYSPALTATLPWTIKQIKAGGGYSLAVEGGANAGRVWGWGANGPGQLCRPGGSGEVLFPTVILGSGTVDKLARGGGAHLIATTPVPGGQPSPTPSPSPSPTEQPIEVRVELEPPTGTVPGGGSLPVRVTTTVVSGSPADMGLSAEGMPPGVTVSFDPPTINPGESATMTVRAAPDAPPGTASLSVLVGRGTSPVPIGSAVFQLTVGPPIE